MTPYAERQENSTEFDGGMTAEDFIALIRSGVNTPIPPPPQQPHPDRNAPKRIKLPPRPDASEELIAFYEYFALGLYGMRRIKKASSEFKTPTSAPAELALNYRFIIPNNSNQHRFLTLTTHDPVTPADIRKGLRRQICAMVTTRGRTDIIFRFELEAAIWRHRPGSSRRSPQDRRAAWTAATIIYGLERHHTARWRQVRHHLDYAEAQRWQALTINPIGLGVDVLLHQNVCTELQPLVAHSDVIQFFEDVGYRIDDFTNDTTPNEKRFAMARIGNVKKRINARHNAHLVDILRRTGVKFAHVADMVGIPLRTAKRYAAEYRR